MLPLRRTGIALPTTMSPLPVPSTYPLTRTGTAIRLFNPMLSIHPSITVYLSIHPLVNSEAKKYKTAPLQHRDLLEKLFDSLSATRGIAWFSGMASVPPSTQQTEYVPLPDDMNVNDIQIPHAGVDYPWERGAIPSYDVPISPIWEPTPGTTSRTQVGVRTQSKRKRSTVAVQPIEPSKLVQSLIFVLTTQGSSSSSASNDGTSSEVLRVLKDMVSSYEIDNALFFKSLKFLEGSNEHTYKLMILGIDPEQCVGFFEALLS
ncbi:hypothetical protein GIB67_010830 [Kingdonia uniflora]|uniref:Uncharacterized protein n=1 Tax=Kingdonia uniflora TaxID=39325 RepID=A0A7J7L975_9MAGN|nr:hypothetical protein GIB67_010830 [Kingdonia uniflora]